MPDTIKDLVHVSISNTPGTAGNLTLGTVVAGWRDLVSGDNGKTFSVTISEAGVGKETRRACAYTHSTRVLTRGTLVSSTTEGAALDFTAAATVSVVMTEYDADQIALVDMINPGLRQAEISVTGAATLTIGRMHVCSGTSADYTVTLPTASGNAGKLLAVRMSSALTRLVTLDGNGSETIDGATTRVMWAGEAAVLMCDGTNWCKIAGKTIPMVGSATPNTSVSCSSGTATKIGLATMVIDNTGLMVDVATNDRITCRRGGEYLATWGLGINNSVGAGSMFGRLYRNGASVTSTYAYFVAGAYPATHGSHRITLTAGDYFEAYMQHYSGVTETGCNGSHLQLTEIPAW